MLSVQLSVCLNVLISTSKLLVIGEFNHIVDNTIYSMIQMGDSLLTMGILVV